MLMLAAVFIGSQACQPCHAAIYAAYLRTPMARSSGRTDSVQPAAFTAAGHKYRIAGNSLIFDGGSAPMSYFVGSMSAGRSFLSEYDGYLFELPVTWYTAKQAWDASPGYEHDAEVRLNRPIESGCLFCHASRVRPVRGAQNRYGDPPFLEDGISCERCHGPGSEHARDPAQAPLVDPAKLGGEARDSVCSQCHLTGEARIERPGRRMADFRPGEPLSDYATFLVWKLGRRDLKVTSHVEKLAASACKMKSGEALWCGTCHEPHTNGNRTQQACVACHPAGHRQQEQCTFCHMPKSRAVDANHGVMTDHSIPRVPKPAAPPVPADLVAFLGVADDRAIGLAYAELGDKRAAEYLRRARPADWPVQLRLAEREQSPAAATALYESVLRANPDQPVALVNLGWLYGNAGRTGDAAKLWERALAANAGIEEAVLNLAQIRPDGEAILLLKRYLQMNPASSAARRMMTARERR